MSPIVETCFSTGWQLFPRILLAPLFLAILLSGCMSKEMSDEERRTRLFLAPGSMGLSLVMPSGGSKGIQTRVHEHKLRSAAENGDDEEVRKQISNSADINARNNEGWSALTLAVKNGHYTTTLLLLGKAHHSWQEPNIVTKNEALNIAVQKTDDKFVDLLLKHGASPDAQNDRRESVLMRAAYVGSPSIMKILLDAGADQTAVDTNGYTAEHWAEIGGCHQCLSLIKQKN